MPSAARAMMVAPLRSAIRSGLSSKLPVMRVWHRPMAPFEASNEVAGHDVGAGRRRIEDRPAYLEACLARHIDVAQAHRRSRRDRRHRHPAAPESASRSRLTFSPVVAAKFSGCFGAMTMRFDWHWRRSQCVRPSPARSSARRSVGRRVDRRGVDDDGVEGWPRPSPRSSVTSRPAVRGLDDRIGAGRSSSGRPASEKASSRSVQDAPLSSVTSAAWIAVLTACEAVAIETGVERRGVAADFGVQRPVLGVRLAS